MKRLAVFSLFLISLLLLFACGDEVCEEHIDSDKNGMCDLCGSELESACAEHADEDFDGICDTCKAFTRKVCAAHTDENVDGICDTCDLKLNREVKLIANGKATFGIVLSSSVSEKVRSEVLSIIDALASFGIEIPITDEDSGEKFETELLVGGVSSRGEKYVYSGAPLGKEGYAIKPAYDKAIISATSDEGYIFALSVFMENVIGYSEDAYEIPDSSFTDDIIYRDEYKITAVKVRGEDISSFTIAVDLTDSVFYEAATSLKSALYSNVGIDLQIVDISNSDRSIVIKRVDDAGEKGFRITTEKSLLNIECAYGNKLQSAIAEFIAYEIGFATGEINFDADYLYEKEISIVTYEEFGAIGNGSVDDYKAIYDAHAFANECGQTVVAKKGAKYLIRNITASIHVKTSVIWEGATITVDDRDLKHGDERNGRVFYFPAQYSKKTLTGKGVLTLFPEGKIDKDNLSIVWPYDFPALVVIYNDNHKNYRRYEGTETAGSAQMEFISVDKNGNISADTPLLFDYEEVTKVEVFRTDDTPITVTGGEIITLASQVPRTGSSNYLGRGMTIKRSNTTFIGVKHYIRGELDKTQAHPSTGFFFIEDSENVTLLNCVLTGRTAGGSYDLSLYRSNNVLLKNCTQSNFFKRDGKTPSMHGNEYWGIMGSNYCKNVTFDTCMLSRFDAHQGIYNATIINSTINAIEVIGGGTFLVENTTFYLSRALMFDLRSDYGSTFRGEIVIRNCHVVNYDPADTAIIKINWHNVYFGYKTYMPNLVIDGLTFDNVIGDVALFKVLATKNSVDYKYDRITEETLLDGTENKNPTTAPDYITVMNNDKGYNYVLFDIFYFDDVILTGAMRKE